MTDWFAHKLKFNWIHDYSFLYIFINDKNPLPGEDYLLHTYTNRILYYVHVYCRYTLNTHIYIYYTVYVTKGRYKNN